MDGTFYFKPVSYNSILSFLLVELKNFGVFQIENFLNSSIHTLLLWIIGKQPVKNFLHFFHFFLGRVAIFEPNFLSFLWVKLNNFGVYQIENFLNFSKMGLLFTLAQPNGPQWIFSTNHSFFWDTLYILEWITLFKQFVLTQQYWHYITKWQYCIDVNLPGRIRH